MGRYFITWKAEDPGLGRDEHGNILCRRHESRTFEIDLDPEDAQKYQDMLASLKDDKTVGDVKVHKA